jgi:hypothetical protein
VNVDAQGTARERHEQGVHLVRRQLQRQVSVEQRERPPIHTFAVAFLLPFFFAAASPMPRRQCA